MPEEVSVLTIPTQGVTPPDGPLTVPPQPPSVAPVTPEPEASVEPEALTAPTAPQNPYFRDVVDPNTGRQFREVLNEDGTSYRRFFSEDQIYESLREQDRTIARLNRELKTGQPGQPQPAQPQQPTRIEESPQYIAEVDRLVAKYESANIHPDTARVLAEDAVQSRMALVEAVKGSMHEEQQVTEQRNLYANLRTANPDFVVSGPNANPIAAEIYQRHPQLGPWEHFLMFRGAIAEIERSRAAGGNGAGTAPQPAPAPQPPQFRFNLPRAGGNGTAAQPADPPHVQEEIARAQASLPEYMRTPERMAAIAQTARQMIREVR